MTLSPVTPKVTLVGVTQALISRTPMDEADDAWSTDAVSLMEFAGRNCYQSFHRPNPDTALNWDYLTNILKQKHYSVLEHASASFYLTGVSRNFTHELVRHRHMSFSELSGRYVNPLKAGLGYVPPPAMESRSDRLDEMQHVYDVATAGYGNVLEELGSEGIKGKNAREAARAYLPGSIETRIVVTANLRSWMEFVSKRDHPAADAEMRNVANMIYTLLCNQFPVIFSQRELWDDQWSQEAPKND